LDQDQHLQHNEQTETCALNYYTEGDDLFKISLLGPYHKYTGAYSQQTT